MMMNPFPLNFTIVVAYDQRRAIGKANQLLWHLRRDLQHFKSITMGKVMLMGRKTFESIGRPLLGRRTVVLTRQTHWQHEGVDVIHTLADLAALLPADTEVMVVGGAQIYEMCLPYTTKMYITEVVAQYEADAYFPDFAQSQWYEVSREVYAADEHNDHDCAFVELVRHTYG